MAAWDDSVWDEIIRRLECAEQRVADLTTELRALQDRVYQPYRLKPAEEWDARTGGSE